eukprot:s1127_g24.t1
MDPDVRDARIRGLNLLLETCTQPSRHILNWDAGRQMFCGTKGKTGKEHLLATNELQLFIKNKGEDQDGHHRSKLVKSLKSPCGLLSDS